jgi:6-phosphogluconolactonase
MGKISRRRFVRNSAVVSVGVPSLSTFAEGFSVKRLLLVGTQTSGSSKGIYAYSFDEATGELTQMGLAAEAENPTFLALAPDGKTLLTANELDEYEGKKGGAVSSFAVDRKTSKLSKISEVAAQGDGTCHVSMDHTGRCAFAANYGGGSAASFTVSKNGQLGPAVSFFQYSGSGPKKQQSGPRAHRVTVSPDNRFLLVNDLGLDAIHIYRLDASTARLTANAPSVWKAAPGSGPRALVFHPSGKWAYCVNELNSSVDVLGWDASLGALTTLQEISLLPEGHEGDSAASEIALDKQGRFAYVANRFDDFVASFTISPTDGKLTLLERTSCGGKIPRHIALDPSEGWLLVANQATDEIAVFARDKNSGHLAKTGKSFPLSKPQCLVFA